MRSFFPNVSRSRYEDSLGVTAIEPIMVYLHSGISFSNLREAELEKLEQELQAELDRKGEIFISKESGLFETVNYIVPHHLLYSLFEF